MDGTWKCIRTINLAWVHLHQTYIRCPTQVGTYATPHTTVRREHQVRSWQWFQTGIIMHSPGWTHVTRTGHIRVLDLSVHEEHIMHLNASPVRIVEIRMETSKESNLHALCEIISLGWPENRAHCQTHLMPFWNFRDELSVEDGLIWYWKVNALSCQSPYMPQH